MPIPAGLGPFFALYDNPPGGTPETWVRDLRTGESRKVYVGDYNSRQVSGTIHPRPEGDLGRPELGNSIELMDDSAYIGRPGGPYLGREFLFRSSDHAKGDPGTFVRLDTLPQSIPEC